MKQKKKETRPRRAVLGHHELVITVTGEGGSGNAKNREELVSAFEAALRDERTKIHRGEYLVLILRRGPGG